MPLTVSDGALVVHGDKLGTEQSCCCQDCAPCPDMESLCIGITLTDYDGNVYTADQNDLFWFGGSGFVYFKDFEYAVLVSCNTSNPAQSIGAYVSWNALLDGCESTSGNGSDALPCSPDSGWYLGTVAGQIQFDPPSGGCPGSLGSFSVTFSDPPC